MKSNFKVFVLLAVSLLAGMCFGNGAFAQTRPKTTVKPKVVKAQPEEAKVTEEVIIKERAADKNSIFKRGDTIKYGIDFKNTYNIDQVGHISYAITDFKNNLITKKAFPITIPAKGNTHVQLDMPSQPAGFYKVNFMLNTNDDDDTVRRVFGVDTARVVSPYKVPDDFWPFWDRTKADLAKVAPQFKVTPMPGLSKGNDEVFLVEMKSLGNLTIRSWMTLPKNRKPGQKLPVSIAFPGFNSEMKPTYGVSGIAYIGINVRGYGNSRDVINPKNHDDLINIGVEDKETYVFKGIMMDCVRLIDFICSQDYLDSKAIFTTGGSLGGYLSLATAGLDDRVTICSGDNPGYPDIRAMSSEVFPINTMKYYAKDKGMDFEKCLKTWDYYCLKGFAQHIKCPVVMGIGLLDNFIAPAASMHAWNNIPSKDKKLFIFPNLAHEVGPEQGIYVGGWVYQKLKVYEKWIAFNKPEAMQPLAVPKVDPNAEVIDLIEHPLTKSAVYKSSSPVTYTVDVKSNFKTTQSGKISYAVTTHDGKPVAHGSQPVTVEAKATKTVSFEIPAQSTPGYYNISFMINTSRYDDTLRRAFAVDTNKIMATNTKPADFDAFWNKAKKELAQVAPKYKVTEMPDMEHNDKVYQIEMHSLNDIVIRGYMALPKEIHPGQKLPVSLYLPGYGNGANPLVATPGMALLNLSVRGQPMSDDVIKPGREEYISTDIEDKNKYIMRGVLMDCVRLVDFACSRPEIDSTAIYASGASMGAYLALSLSALDKRVTITTASNPVFSNFRDLAVESKSFPIGAVKLYAEDKGLKMGDLLNTLDYFDLQNFAGNITAPTVVGIGMLDNLAPPTPTTKMFNAIKGNKKLFVFPTMAHEIGADMNGYVGKWVYEKLNIWNRYLAFNKQDAADKVKEAESGSESVVIIEHPGNKEAVFKANSIVDYNVDLKNNFFKKVDGTFSYFVYTDDDKLIKKDTVKVSIDSRGTRRMHVEVPPQKTGFYKINFAIDVGDYDDTLKRVFGVNIEAIRSTYPRPADFDAFWDRTKKELAAIPPQFKMTEQPQMETGNGKIYLVEMQSLGNITIRAWLTVPKDRKPKEKLPVFIQLPGYGNAMVPAAESGGMAFFALNVRGQGNSRDVIHPQREEYIGYDLDDKDKYIYRGSIMDAMRLIDFVYAHSDMFDTESIFVTGGSQGGYLTLCLASLDHRVSLCEAENPGYIDLKMPYYKDKWPMTVFRDVADQKAIKVETLLDNFEYFNLKNFVQNIKCKVIVGIGLLDPLVPPTNEMIMYNSITAWKKLFIFPNLTHEVGPELGSYKTKWMIDELGAF
ncbi:acetylxylan esterase [Mucilaginibacter sp. HMF5004]|uniref:acetylxylan esterase n=1 Tax=Mucilaginibacter rivuli TaxID=2857527 RepID=UPI001C5F2166|nr:acetylxylan esterase [Mucilaginibacter rivuli]MBW4890885.1 acetylxylan esterase [Mucilaginibacter rivuli]